MRQGAKPAKAKVEAELAVLRKSLKSEASRRRELEKRLAEALEQQTATAEILRVISSSPTDLQPVLDAVAQSAARLCEAEDASIYRVRGEFQQLVAHHGPVGHADDTVLMRIGRDMTTGRAVLDRRTIQVPDLATADDEFPRVAPLARRFGHHTTLAVPLLREGVGAGAILIRRREIRPFTDRQIDLLQTFADQAVIAIENVRLFQELQERNRELTEALDQQTTTAEILRVISGSPTDVQPVFETIAKNAMRLCDGVYGAVFRVEGDRIDLVAHHNIPPEGVDEIRRRYPASLSVNTGAARAARERVVVQISDVETDPTMTEARRRLARIVGYRSQGFVPMLRGDRTLGVINVNRREAEPFPDQQIALLQTFADQAVIAIENARLFQELGARNRELTESLEQQTATAEILRVISSSPTDVRPVFDAIATSAPRVCEVDNANVYRFDGRLIHLVASHGYTEEELSAVKGVFPIPPGRGSATARAVSTGEIVHILDPSADSEHTYPALVESGLRTVLSVPMLRDGKPIGAITVARREVRPFSERQIALLQTFAAQAVIAVENVRLFTELGARNRELTEALEQQTATSEILRVISSSPTDVQPVFDAIVRSATRLADAALAGLIRLDGRMLTLDAYEGMSEAEMEIHRRAWPREVAPDSVGGRTILNRRVVHITDAREDPEYAVSSALTLGYRTALGVPLLREGVASGAIALWRREVRPFADEQIQLVRTFADQAVIAIENVRLLQELQARTRELARSVEELKALGEVSRAVSSTLDLEIVLQTIVSRASQLAGADGCAIWEYHEDAEEFRVRATHNLDASFVEALRAMPLRRGEGAMGRATEAREPLQIADISVPGAYQSRVRGVLIEAGYRAVISVPMLLEEQVIGSLSLVRKVPEQFPAEVVELLKNLATQSALAIQNARLFQEIEDKGRQLEAASRHKSEFLANMSHELRTPLNAILGFNEMILGEVYGDVPPDLREPLTDIQSSGKHLLRLINNVLDLSKIEAGRMELALTDYAVEDIVERVRVSLHPLAVDKRLEFAASVPEEIPLAYGDVGRITQCLMNLAGNALKFTRQGRVGISVDLQGDLLVYRVADTGIGIAKDRIETLFAEFRQGDATITSEFGGTGLGLSITKKFVEMHRGRIWVESELGKGATFSFAIPLRLAGGQTA